MSINWWMSKYILVYPYSCLAINRTGRLTRTTTWLNLKTCWVKENEHWVHTVRFYLHKIQEWENHSHWKQIIALLFYKGGGWSPRGPRKLSNRNFLYINCCSDYTTAYICHNSSNCAILLTWVPLTVWKLYPNRFDLKKKIYITYDINMC